MVESQARDSCTDGSHLVTHVCNGDGDVTITALLGEQQGREYS